MPGWPGWGRGRRRSGGWGTRSRRGGSPRRSGRRWCRGATGRWPTRRRRPRSPTSTGCRSPSRPPSAVAAVGSGWPAPPRRSASSSPRRCGRPRPPSAAGSATWSATWTDTAGTVVVVGDRDCSLQRRHQKLVEEAPAPALDDGLRDRIHRAARDICAEAGYAGAGTVEFLLGEDGTLTFPEANTRLQVEHPVTEEVTGVDLIREMFRVAAEERLDPATPAVRGHAIEFRINGEDPGRGFLPTPGTVTRWRPPAGPGVRLDAGVEQGGVVGGAFDSLLAKLIVAGADRGQALERSRRALDEFEVEGLATVLPFHRLVVREPAFAEAFAVHTGWIEAELGDRLQPQPEAATPEEAAERERVVVEVGGRRLEVTLPAGLGAAPGPPARRPARRPPSPPGGAEPAGEDAVVAPMEGTIVKVAVGDGQQVEAGDLVVVLEAMKMEQPLTAHRAGTVAALDTEVGAKVQSGATICRIES